MAQIDPEMLQLIIKYTFGFFIHIYFLENFLFCMPPISSSPTIFDLETWSLFQSAQNLFIKLLRDFSEVAICKKVYRRIYIISRLDFC